MDLKRIALRTSGYLNTDQKVCVEHTRRRKVQGVVVIVLAVAVCGLLQLGTKPIRHQDRQV